MDYRKLGSTIYIRMDRGDEVIASILDICKNEHIQSATYNGIGGCSSAAIQTFDPASGSFRTEEKTGMLELVSLMGHVITDGNQLYHHTHAMFSFVADGEHKVSRLYPQGGRLPGRCRAYAA